MNSPSDFPPDALSVQVVGIVRGREINATAVVTLDTAAVVLSWPTAAAWRLELDGIEGVGTGPSSLTVYLRDHDVLELSGSDALRPLAQAIVDRACRMPELTRGLRELGAVRRTDIRANGRSPLHTAHDMWFAPLLAARQAVHGVSDPSRQVTLMDGAALTAAMSAASAQIATTLAPENAAEQRALEAAIEDEAAPLFAALERLRLAGQTVQTGATDTRIADWRRWVLAARDVFAGADEAWGQIAQIVGES
ncbi:hypothetical protein [Gemmatimonas phototrophica]|uniref:Uncharacterized protein n=1 Tax=Gemmatimonas phototrophica TaxID=1379270 RepID=A0A143BGN7_9BACT|nr:hypothetical protein [Gemmatimonas phototrophica]AMW04208.1 hypothetical protein GEMMAAP_03845 [Gemmatimonas phototrophica]